MKKKKPKDYTLVDELECEALDWLSDNGLKTDEGSILSQMGRIAGQKNYWFLPEKPQSVKELAERCEALRKMDLATFFRSRYTGPATSIIEFRGL